MQAVLDGMRSGKSFSVFGDLINALDYTIAGGGSKGEMGGDLQVKEGEQLQLTIRFKSPLKNANNDPVQVDHVDLISGDVTGKTVPGTDAYNKDTNDSTKVLKRFTSQDWTTDADGYNVINYNVGAASKNQYFRLRGTNLGLNVDGETSNGEPLADPKTDNEDNETRFTEINKRNFKDLWFYSNPIFVSVKPNCADSNLLRLCGKLTTADGELYAPNAWTNQNVTTSVYASVYVPDTTVSINLTQDGNASQPYVSKSDIMVSQEGQHTLLFQASDTNGNMSSLPLKVNIDKTPPVMKLKGNTSVTVTAGDAYTEQGADATDTLGVADKVIITGTVDTKTVGTYTLHYNLRDLAGNAAPEIVRTVNVVARDGESNRGSNTGTGPISPPAPTAAPAVEINVDAKKVRRKPQRCIEIQDSSECAAFGRQDSCRDFACESSSVGRKTASTESSNRVDQFGWPHF
ncbi:DUF5011 domain-containing protein [Paenibacillus alginolyticus]|uniref:DUF5011 domain-containing protein n=1 Tax=Paenibacillus alginolyticus TaxID=59839 RepID=UPI001FE66A4E|nr:DUF5011 domain-containing protein [Paenibacillus frigoriresistens]